MSYTTLDFSESLHIAKIDPKSVERVIAGWGKGDGSGDDAGHWKWAPDGASDWAGGFLMALKDGRFAYLTGWCDYTGWGCQDGAEVKYFDHQPTIESLNTSSDRQYGSGPNPDEWDIEPADLNRWLTEGSKDL